MTVRTAPALSTKRTTGVGHATCSKWDSCEFLISILVNEGEHSCDSRVHGQETRMKARTMTLTSAAMVAFAIGALTGQAPTSEGSFLSDYPKLTRAPDNPFEEIYV